MTNDKITIIIKGFCFLNIVIGSRELLFSSKERFMKDMRHIARQFHIKTDAEMGKVPFENEEIGDTQAAQAEINVFPIYNFPNRFWRGLQLSNRRKTVLHNLFLGYWAETGLNGTELRKTTSEELIPEELAHPDLIINPEIYKRLRYFLE